MGILATAAADCTRVATWSRVINGRRHGAEMGSYAETGDWCEEILR